MKSSTDYHGITYPEIIVPIPRKIYYMTMIFLTNTSHGGGEGDVRP
jgi:hypothetical protein